MKTSCTAARSRHPLWVKILVLLKVALLVTGTSCLANTVSVSAALGETTVQSVVNSISGQVPTITSDGRKLVLPSVPNGYTVRIFGSSNTAVISKEGNITKPLQTTDVNIFYEVANTRGETAHSDTAVVVTVYGLYAQDPSANPKPNVVPQLREWKGDTGNFVFGGKIIISDNSLSETAEMVKFYLEEMIGNTVTVSTGSPSTGDIVLLLDNTLTVGEEGYTMDIGDILTVKAPAKKGLLYAGTSISQILYQDNTHTKIPKGLVRDYPQYAVRSVMLDVARFYMPIDYLVEVTKYAAYFKLNEIHVHINDDFGEQKSAFRVESKLFPQINQGITYYTQDEYRAYQTEVAKYGIEVVTEIDTPAHSGFLSFYDNSLMLDASHINLSNPKSYEFIENLFNEFLDGENPVIQSSKFHIGTDEYDKKYSEDMRKYIDHLINFVSGKGYEVRFWASLGSGGFVGNTPVSNNAVANFWAADWAGFNDMLRDGYSFINNSHQKLYVVPGAGYYNDYLNMATLFENWEVTDFDRGYTLQAGHPQLLGAEACVWCDVKAGISQFDYFDRLHNSIMLMSEKNWYGDRDEDESGEEFVERVNAVNDYAPEANPARYVKSLSKKVVSYDFETMSDSMAADSSGNGYDAAIHNLSITEGKSSNALALDGQGYLSLPFDTIGFPYTMEFDMYIDSTTPANAVLFSGDDGTFYYNYDNTGYFGYERKGYVYLLNVTVPVNTWTHIMITSNNYHTYMYVNEYSSGEGNYYKNGAPYKSSSTFVLPTQKIGNGLIGKLDNLIIYNQSTSEEDLLGSSGISYGNLAIGKQVTASGVEGGFNPDGSYVYPQFNLAHAVDNNVDTRISLERKNESWLTVDLGDTYLIDRIEFQFGQRPKAYKVQVSTDNNTWKTIETYENLAGASAGLDATTLPKLEGVRFVRYQQIQMFDLPFGSYSGNFSEMRVYGVKFDDMIQEITQLKLTLENIRNESNSDYIDAVFNTISKLEESVEAKDLASIRLFYNMVIRQMQEYEAGNGVVVSKNTQELERKLNSVANENDYDHNNAQWTAYQQAVHYGIRVMYTPQSTQDDVDFAVQYLTSTMSKLLPAEFITITSKKKTYIDSTADYHVYNLIDGNLTTKAWFEGNQAVGDYVLFEFREATTLWKVYLDSTNVVMDVLHSGELQVSNDGNTWTTVATLNQDRQLTRVFNPVTVKYMRIIVTSNTGYWWQLNEVVFNDHMVVDKLQLHTVINRNLNPDQFTTESWAAYQQVIQQATIVYNNATATTEQVMSSILAVRNAYNALEYLPG